MKKLILLIFYIIAVLSSKAQDYRVTFAAAGDTTEVGTVKVTNLTNGDTVILNGGDTLQLKSYLGIKNREKHNNALQIYPNPMTDQSLLTFDAPTGGNADLRIMDLAGKTICQMDQRLSAGKHTFQVTGVPQGICFVKVTGPNYSYSAKLISQASLPGDPRIDLVSSQENSAGFPVKNNLDAFELRYNVGDQLLFKGNCGAYSTIVTGFSGRQYDGCYQLCTLP